ncbi:MAG: elongation factor P [Planctomycetota bacterium]|nr:MAG: elongation factor P [Planctomycetota bacterium]
MIANDLRNGTTILHNNELYEVVDYQHTKPGKGGAFMKTKLKNLKTGTIIEHTFRAQERVQDAFIEKKEMIFSYRDGDMFYFMDENYEMVPVSKEVIGEYKNFLREDQECLFWYHEGEIVRVVLPEAVILEVKKTEPGVKGDTASSATKPGTLETGLTIQMPLFINEGDKVKVDTRTGKYIERVS